MADAVTRSQWVLYFALELIRVEHKLTLAAAIALAAAAHDMPGRAAHASAEQAARSHAAMSTFDRNTRPRTPSGPVAAS